jgi:hypothetical protein
MSYNRSYVFRHCPLGVNSVRHSRVRVIILLETRVVGGEPEGGEGAQRGQGRGGDASGEQDTTRRQHEKVKTEEVDPTRTLQPIKLGIEQVKINIETI